MGMGMATQTQFHVLAVDDSLIDRKLIEKLLKTSSFQVTAVDSGAKALEFLGLTDENIEDEMSCSSSEAMVVNLIITDYCMPGMSGYDLLRKIKQSAEFKDIPVVIMSSENIPSRINRCLEDGADGFFLKPVQLSDVNKLRPHLMKGITSDEMRSTVTKEREWKKFSPMRQQEKDTVTWKVSGQQICYFPRKIFWVFSIFVLFGVWIGKGG